MICLFKSNFLEFDVSKYIVKKMYGIKFAYPNKAVHSDNCDTWKAIDSLEIKQELVRNI